MYEYNRDTVGNLQSKMLSELLSERAGKRAKISVGRNLIVELAPLNSLG